MFNIPKFKKTNDKSSNLSPSNLILPLLPLRDIVVFPYMVVPLFVGRDKSINALAASMHQNKNVFMAAQQKIDLENPDEKDIYLTGTIGKVIQLLKLPDKTVKALVEGKSRARILQFVSNKEYFQAELGPIKDLESDHAKTETITRSVIKSFKAYSKINKNLSQDLVNNIFSLSNPGQLADVIAAHLPFKIKDKQRILETIPLDKRLSILLKLIKKETEIFQIEKKIKGRVKNQMEKTQKNYYLTEQMRAIKKEMGTEDENQDDLKDLEKSIKRKRMSREAAGKVRQEFRKLKRMAPMSSESAVVRNYIEWLISLPWFKRSKTRLDIDEAEKILNEDHYGLKKPKERILEYLAVQSLVKKIRGPILCFVGPPGVGKTSLARSVARSTGREFIRLSLGGVRDEAEIRGHRRTYIGAMPGKIIQSLKKAGVNNPVYCLDEVDKMSMDFRGDPSAALLEVLDPEQNNSFNDHYLDVDYDLSEIMFITTANTLPDIPLPLQDRMEIIRLAGYTEYEKLNIANNFLIPKQTEMNGLSPENINFSENAILNIIQHYTKEAGVRNLEREIASVCRKVAREIVKQKDDKEAALIKIDKESIAKHLGPQRFHHGQKEKEDQVGLVTGLAWTQVGGELLCAETIVMPGKGQILITGKLGDVMKESAQAAVSYVRSRAACLGIDSKFYKNLDIHIHVPEGAIPKDGPSAGITMCTSIVSALTRRPVHREIAMTGEITLRGRVLPIGGLKEKILAAHRGGIKQVIIPKENKKDLEDIPSTVLKQIEMVTVEKMDEVLTKALVIQEGETLFNEQEDKLPPIECMIADNIENVTEHTPS
ncbi:Lon protease [Candidatus Magnetomoraceae bacterium gMMP-15]